MIEEHELQALIPSQDTAHPHPQHKNSYAAGIEAGLASPRPGAANESSLLEAMQRQIEAIPELDARAAFVEGYEHGVHHRIEAERRVSQIYRLCSGRLRGRILRRVFASARAMRRLAESLQIWEKRVIESAFSARYQMDLHSALQLTFGAHALSRLWEITAPDCKNSEELFHQVEYSAAKLEASLRGSGEIWVGRFFLGRNAEQRRTLIEQYEARYGKLDLRSHFKGWELEFVQDLVAHGRVGWAKLLYFCVIGVGTDEQGLRDLLEAMNAVEINQAALEYRALWRERAPWYERPFPHLLGDLQRRIWLETGGDCWFDLQDYFRSNLPAPQDLNQRLEKLYQHERSGALLKRIDFFSREGLIMNRDVAAVREYYQHFVRNAEFSLAAQLRFRALVWFAELDCEIFRSFKHFFGNTISNLVAAVTAGSAAYALSLNRVEIEAVMVCVGTISIGSRLILKNLFKGRGYHREEVLADVFFGTLDGVTLFTAYLFRQALLNLGTRFLAKFGLRSGVSHAGALLGRDRARHMEIELSELALRSETCSV